MKKSEVNWIDTIPDSWNVARLKALFSCGKGLPITKENLTTSGVSVISYGQIHAKFNTGVSITPDLLRYVSPDYLQTNQTSLVHFGDFIFADTSEDLTGCGNCAYVDTDGLLFAGYHTIILQARTEKNNKYLAYLFLTDSWRSQIRSRVSGVKLYSISRKILMDTTVIIPPKNVQESIVSVLDVKCAEIDYILRKMRLSIEEYKQLKQSIIMQAITKGVDDNRITKDSGSIWFGNIPSEWKMRRLKYVFHIKKEIAGKEGYTVLSITQRGIIPKDLSKNEGQLAQNYSNYQLVEPGDFAMNHMDLLTGWVDISKYSGVTSPDYRVFVLNDKDAYCDRYYLYMMQMCYTNRIFYGLGQGVSTMGRWRLQADKFLNFMIAVPPIEEQREIADYLDEKCIQIDDIITKKEKLITELEAYKKSLIYEYVTGKKEVC
ncbi:MAG: restriction endonuclease subunit S [Lachnospiraceae bacterium]|nr:restriction endonuclease subunit S [Lachnospiraceae bacterium]